MRIYNDVFADIPKATRISIVYDEVVVPTSKEVWCPVVITQTRMKLCKSKRINTIAWE